MNRCAEYLSGTADWEQWNIRERLKGTREFKDLGVADFRTKPERELRDAAYARNGIAFLQQASVKVARRTIATRSTWVTELPYRTFSRNSSTTF
jgi:hypothetical protein